MLPSWPRRSSPPGPIPSTPNERLGAACERALASGAISYTSVKSILAQGLDRVPLPASAQLPAPPDHENLRGASYWADQEKEA
jgi:hypothetical protein